MTNDSHILGEKIIAAVRVLHDRFVEEPTDKKVDHLKKFIRGSHHDLEYPTSQNLYRYLGAVMTVEAAKFSPKSLTHLNEIAKQTLGETT